jgi:hypothetical protein
MDSESVHLVGYNITKSFFPTPFFSSWQTEFFGLFFKKKDFLSPFNIVVAAAAPPSPYSQIWTWNVYLSSWPQFDPSPRQSLPTLRINFQTYSTRYICINCSSSSVIIFTDSTIVVVIIFKLCVYRKSWNRLKHQLVLPGKRSDCRRRCG